MVSQRAASQFSPLTIVPGIRGFVGIWDLRIGEGSVSATHYSERSANLDDASALYYWDGLALCLVIWAFLLILFEENICDGAIVFQDVACWSGATVLAGSLS